MADVMRDPRVLLAACLLHPLPVALATAIKEVLATAPPQQAEPVQEPVAWMRPDNRVAEESYSRTQFSRGRDKPPIGTWTPLYTAPPQQAEPVQSAAGVDAYDMIDRFLRNNLRDDDYAEYSAALDSLYTAPQQRKPLTDEEIEQAHGIKEAK